MSNIESLRNRMTITYDKTTTNKNVVSRLTSTEADKPFRYLIEVMQSIELLLHIESATNQADACVRWQQLLDTGHASDLKSIVGDGDAAHQLSRLVSRSQIANLFVKLQIGTKITGMVEHVAQILVYRLRHDWRQTDIHSNCIGLMHCVLMFRKSALFVQSSSGNPNKLDDIMERFIEILFDIIRIDVISPVGADKIKHGQTKVRLHNLIWIIIVLIGESNVVYCRIVIDNMCKQLSNLHEKLKLMSQSAGDAGQWTELTSTDSESLFHYLLIIRMILNEIFANNGRYVLDQSIVANFNALWQHLTNLNQFDEAIHRMCRNLLRELLKTFDIDFVSTCI